MRPAIKPKNRQVEHAEQTALFRWAEMRAKQHPELGLLYAVPNGARTAMATAVKLKAEGLRAGFPDVGLPVPDFCPTMGGPRRYGLFLELKAPGMKLKPRQAWWKACLEAQGYAHAVCYSWQEAARAIYSYLDIEEEI